MGLNISLMGDMFALFVAVAVVALSVSACDDGASSRKVARSKTESKGAASSASKKEESAPQKKKASTVKDDESAAALNYEHKENSGYRDPFLHHIEDLVSTGGEEGALEIPRSPQEMFGLDEFTMVAMITGTPVPKVMLKDPTGYGHVLKLADPIGREGGRIVDILPNELRVALPPDPDTGEVSYKIYRLYDETERADYQLNVVKREEPENAEDKDLEDLDIDDLLGVEVAGEDAKVDAGVKN